MKVDLNAQTVSFGETQVDFEIDPFAKHCLLNGIDELGYTYDAHGRDRGHSSGSTKHSRR